MSANRAHGAGGRALPGLARERRSGARLLARVLRRARRRAREHTSSSSRRCALPAVAQHASTRAAAATRFDQGDGVDRRLSHARPPRAQLDPLGPEAAREQSRARSAHLRLRRRRPRSPDLPRRRALASRRRRCADRAARCAAPTAASSASSTCTSRIPRSTRGSSSASRARSTAPSSSARGKIEILDHLTAAETFERFIHRKWVRTKRFGLDGAESTIPALEQIVRRAVELGVEEDRDRRCRTAGGSTCSRT